MGLGMEQGIICSRPWMMRTALFATGALLGFAMQAQRVTDSNANLWISHWGDHRIHRQWSFHTEGHWRRAEMGQGWQQLLLRPAFNFHLNDAVLLTAGYSYYGNYPYGAYPVRFRGWEHQAWEQVQLAQSIGRVRLTHRYRLEQRFIAVVVPSANDPGSGVLDRYDFQSRLRYRIWATVPLGSKEPGPGGFSLNAYDEVFIGFGASDRIDFVQQNRISLLLGHQLSRSCTMLGGYLFQNIQRPGAAAGADLMELNSTIHVAFVCNLDLRRPSAPSVD